MTELGFERLFFKCADNFFETGKTPINKSGTILSKNNTPDHMDKGTSLSVFSELYKKYRNTKGGWMLFSFFIAQLFKQISSNNLENEILIVNMLEELLLNYPTRDLKTRPERTEIAFKPFKNFDNTFQRILRQELDMNKKDSKKRADKATATIRSEFEKTSSKIKEERENSKSSTSCSFSRSLKKSFHFHPIHLKLQACRRLDHNFTIKRRIQGLILT